MNSLLKDSSIGGFSVNIPTISKTFFTEDMQTTGSGFDLKLNFFDGYSKILRQA